MKLKKMHRSEDYEFGLFHIKGNPNPVKVTYLTDTAAYFEIKNTPYIFIDGGDYDCSVIIIGGKEVYYSQTPISKIEEILKYLVEGKTPIASHCHANRDK